MTGRKSILDSLRMFQSRKSKIKDEDERQLQYVGAKLSSCSLTPPPFCVPQSESTRDLLGASRISFTETLTLNEIEDQKLESNNFNNKNTNNNNSMSDCLNSSSKLNQCHAIDHEHFTDSNSNRSDSVNNNLGDNSDSKFDSDTTSSLNNNNNNNYCKDNDSNNNNATSVKVPSKRRPASQTALALPTNNELQQYKGFLKLSLCGLILIALSYAIYIINPVDIIKSQRLRFFEGSFAYGLWKKPPVKVYINVYIFNVTNSEEFRRGDATELELKEIGPYVYWEELENQNVTFHTNKTLSYTPNRLIHYDAELSVGDPDLDLIVVPNIPLLGISSMLYNSSMFVNIGLRTLVTYLDTQPFRTVSVHEYLWGYDEPLVQLASNILPSWINFAKFGLLDRMLDEGKNRITMNIPTSSSKNADSFTISEFNGNPGLGQWGLANATERSDCGTLQGSTEGLLYPRHLTPERTFNLYRKAFCRTLPIEYYSEGLSERGVKVFKYKFAKGVFDSPSVNSNNKCYCKRDFAPCLPSGLSDLSPCYYNIPVAVSFPHFFGADPITSYKLKGLTPNKTLHESSITIQPTKAYKMLYGNVELPTLKPKKNAKNLNTQWNYLWIRMGERQTPIDPLFQERFLDLIHIDSTRNCQVRELGVPITVDTKVQINLVMHNTKYIPRVKLFNNMTIPIFWLHMEVNGLPDSLNILIDLLLIVAPPIQTASILCLAFSGLGLLTVASIGYVISAGFLRNKSRMISNKPAILKATWGSATKYSPVHIIPIIRHDHFIARGR